MCLGAHVARLEGRVLIEEVLRAMPDYEIDTAGIERLRSEFFRGFAALPIRFAPSSRRTGCTARPLRRSLAWQTKRLPTLR